MALHDAADTAARVAAFYAAQDAYFKHGVTGQGTGAGPMSTPGALQAVQKAKADAYRAAGGTDPRMLQDTLTPAELAQSQQFYADFYRGANGTPAGAAAGGTTPGGGTTGPGGTFTPSGGTAEQQDAYAYISGLLKQYGLPDSLSQWAWSEITNNRSQSQVALDLLNQPAFKDRFGKVMDARRASGLPPVSAGDIVSYENSWSQVSRAGGLPSAMQGRDVAQTLMSQNVSMSEANDRVQQAYVKVTQAPVEVRAAWDSFFGAQSDSALASFILDDNLALPDLEKKVAEAQAAGVAHQHGFTIDEALARRLANQGVSFDQAQQGFGVLESERHLFDQTISEASPLSQTTGIEAQFGLTPGAQETVQRTAERRRADYAGGAGLAETQQGLIGAGQARQT